MTPTPKSASPSGRFLQTAKPGEKEEGQYATIDPLNPHRMEVSYDQELPPTEFRSRRC